MKRKLGLVLAALALVVVGAASGVAIDRALAQPPVPTDVAPSGQEGYWDGTSCTWRVDGHDAMAIGSASAGSNCAAIGAYLPSAFQLSKIDGPAPATDSVMCTADLNYDIVTIFDDGPQVYGSAACRSLSPWVH